MNEKCLDMQKNSKSSEGKDAGCPFLKNGSQVLFREHAKVGGVTFDSDKEIPFSSCRI